MFTDLTTLRDSVILPIDRETCHQDGSPDFAMPALPWGQVHAILTKFSEMSPGARLEWQSIGGALRKDLSLAECWRLTVACKLDKTPKSQVRIGCPLSALRSVVEQIMDGEAAATELRNRIEEEQRLLTRGGKTFEWITPQLRLDRVQLERIQKNLHRLRCLRDKHGSLYEQGMEYLARAFGACVAEDPSFWPFVERAET